MCEVTTRPEPAPAQGGTSGTSDPMERIDAREPDHPRLTVAAVARRLGVAPATLRTWDRRYGLGPSEHVSGKHRRYGPDDVARLEHMQRALLRGASPAEAARYARNATVPLPQRYPVANDERAAGPSPDGAASGEPGTSEPLMVSGVLDSAAGGSMVFDSYTGAGGRGLKLNSGDPRARGLGRAVLALDSWSAQRLLIEAMETGGVVDAWQNVLQPVLRAVAERRNRSGSGTEVLRLLVDCAATAVRAVIANAPSPLNPRPVVLAPVTGEAQELELITLAAALAAQRIGTRLFGAALPKEGLDAAVRRLAPAAVVLWAEQPPYASPQLIGELPSTRQRVRALAAGPGWSPAALPAHVEFVDGVQAALDRVVEIVLGCVSPV